MSNLASALTNIVPFAGFPRQPYIILAGSTGVYKSPGTATVKGLDMPRDYDERQGYGYSLASLIYKGQKLSSFQVEIVLLTPDDFVAWNLFAKVLAPPIPGPASQALGIKHPIVNGPPHGITSVVVINVSQPEQNDTGKWTYTISFKQWGKPLAALARPIAAIPAAAPPQPTAQDAAETKMLQLVAQAQALGG